MSSVDRSARFLPFAVTKFSQFVVAAGAMLALFAGPSQANAQCSGTGTVTYNSSGGVSVAAGTISTSTNAITVLSFPAGTTVTCVSVILHGVTSDGQTYSSMNYANFLLTAPQSNGNAGGSQKLAFLGATGDGTDGDDNGDGGSGLHSVTINVADNAGSLAPAYPAIWSTASSFTVKPSSFHNLPANNESGGPPLPPGGNSSEWATSDGNGTFNSVFVVGGAPPAGAWTLSLRDDSPNPGDPVSVSSWSLVMTTVQTTNASSTTSLSSGLNPAFTSGGNSSVTLTATVTSGGNPVTVGTVNFTDGATTLCSGKPLNGSGQATCATTFATEGTHGLQAVYSGGTGFNASGSSGLNEYVKNHSTLSSGQYCNAGTITENGSVTPYPSVINVGTDTSALGGTVAGVTVQLKNLTDSSGLGPGYAFLLVAPDRTQAYDLDFLSNAGSSGNRTATVTFADGNPSAPLNGALSGSYEATDYNSSADTFVASTSPAPTVPGTINYPQPDFFGTGGKTFAQAFGNANGTGDWALFAYNGTGTPISVAGWCLSFEVNNGAPTTTTLTSSVNPAGVGAAVKLIATVTSSSTVNSGTLSIVDNTTGTTLASGTPSNGVVQVLTSTLVEGDHDIVATYSGVPNVYDPSTKELWQRVDAATTVSGDGTAANPALYCNANGITLPSPFISNNIGPASPNPSNIFPSNLPGTLKSVEVEMIGLHTADPVITDTATLLVGSNGVGFDFFSGTGQLNNTLLSTGNYNFADGNATVPASNFGPGTYEATDRDSGTDTFFASPSGFYTLPGAYDDAQPHSSPFTFNGASGGAFTDIDANGTWSLYFNQNIHDTGAGMNEWCLSFVENLPNVSPVATHAGDFVQGEPNQTLTLNVTNEGNGPTGDPSKTNPMTVVDTVPAGFAITGASGSGWTCGTAAQVVTCTTHATVAQGSGYNPITINVNVNSNAIVGPVSNSFSTSGGGANSASSGSDSINIGAAANLSVTKTHPGTFTQGSTAEWDVTVSNVATSGTTYGQVTMTDTLPTGYSVNSFTAAGWSCSGTTSITCTSVLGEPGGSSFPVIQMFVSVPATSPSSVTNTAKAFGGGDLNHTNGTTAAVGTDANVPVVQVPASITIISGNNQSAGLGAAFAAPLVVQVKDAAGAFIQGSSVTFVAPAAGATGTFSNTINSITVSTDVNGNANSGAFTANAVLGGPYQVSASDSPAGNVNFSLTNVPGAAATLLLTGVPATAVSGTSFPFAVTAYDAYGNQATGYSGTVNITTSDPSAPVQSPITMGGGTGTGSATLATPGNQTITATDSVNPGLTGTSGTIAVSAPYLVVTTPNDDTSVPVAGNCTPQAAPGAGSDSNCSLRDALAAAANDGAGNISFNNTQFSTPQTITVGVDGVMTIPANTSINGPTSGSGYSLANLVTIDGGGANQIFQVTGTSSVSDVTIQNGSAAGGGAAVQVVNGAFTLANCSILNNSASPGNPGAGQGGAITAIGTALNISNCTFSGNTAGEQAGAIYVSGGTLSITDSTFNGNSSNEAGAISFNGSTGTITNSTFAGNSDQSSAGAIESFKALTMNNNIISSNTTALGGAIYTHDDAAATLNADSNVFYGNLNGSSVEADIVCSSGTCAGPSTVTTNSTSAATNPVAPLASYGGPTQTMLPLPDGGALCSASKTNAINAGISADQRGLALDPRCNNGQVDAGAVQTSYALTFLYQPPVNAIVGVPMIPLPEVHLTENGQTAFAPVTPISMSDSAAQLGGTISEPLHLGSAIFDNLIYSAPALSDTLTAILPLNSSLAPPVTVSVNSNTVNAYIGALLTSPAPSSTLTGPSVTFTWSTSPSATGYQFWLGTAGRGSNDLYSSGQTMGTGFTSITVNNIPTNGQTIYARLYTNISGTWLRIDYTFTASTQTGITSPTPGSTLSGFSTTFNWTPNSGTQYVLWLGSTGVNSHDIYSSGNITGTSATANIPANGETVYARLYALMNGTWVHTDYTYTAPTLTQGAITSPTPGSALTNTSTTFTWSAGIGATGYELWLGTTGINSHDLYSSGEVVNPAFLSTTAPSLPTNGTTIYARLYTDFNGTWLHTDYTYTASSVPAITSPTPGSTLNGYSATFTWSPAGGATAYQLWVGDAGKASNDLLSSGVITATTATAIHLPYNGTTLYVRLWSQIGGVWNHLDYTYTAGVAPALTSPTPSSTLSAAPVTFTWSAGTGATSYVLWLGTTGVNSHDVFSSGEISSTSAVVSHLPSGGGTVYARLYFEVNGIWSHLDYTYTAP